MSAVRAAFDLGSSHHKVVIASVSPPNAPQVLYSNSLRIPLADALASSRRGHVLPHHILEQSLSFLTQEKRNAESIGATSFCAIATHAFRHARNGHVHLNSLRRLGIHVVTLTQDEEGELAFLTAISKSNSVPPDAVVWDSGGGSTQWSYMLTGCIRVHPLPIGSAAVRAAYAAFNDRHASGVTKLVNWVSAYATPIHYTLSARFRLGAKVLGIGGHNSMFAIMAAHRGCVQFTQTHVWDYVDTLIASRDREMKANVLPKMVLLAQLMASYGIRSVTYLATNGNCLGLLASERTRFWPELRHPQNDPFFDEVVHGTSLTPRC